MGDTSAALARMAASTRFGLLTTSQLAESGLDRHHLGGLVRAGQLHRVIQGVYALDAPCWIDQLRAITRVRLPGRAIVSHRSAARLHGLWQGDELDVTVRYPDQAKCSGANIHRSRDLVPGVVMEIDGLPVTSVARTLCDLGLVLAPWSVRRAVEHAIATGRTTRDEVERIRWGVSEHGRTGVGAVDDALRELPLRAGIGESGPEVRLMAILGEAGPPGLVPQHRVEVDGHRYRLDLAYPELMVAVEYDGEAFHSRPEQVRADRERQQRLEGAGWRVVRVTRHDLYSAASGSIVRRIRAATRRE